MKFSVELEDEGDSELFEDLQRYLKYHPKVTRFLFNPAGLTFLVGWLLFIGNMFGLLTVLIIDPKIGAHIFAVMTTEVVAGREVAIPLGLELGVPALITWSIAATQDLITTSWVYPLFYLFRKQNLGKENFAGYFFAKMEKSAEKNKEFVERWGALGLFGFMLIPFAVNGPLIGAVLGKLAGIRTRYILPTVVLATITGTSLWTILYLLARPQVEAFTAAYGGDWIKWAMAGLAFLILLRVLWGFWRDAARYRRLRARREERARRRGLEQTLYAVHEAPEPGGEDRQFKY